jgi:general secretion pathway protein D
MATSVTSRLPGLAFPVEFNSQLKEAPMTTFFKACALMSVVFSPLALAEDAEPAAHAAITVAPIAGELDIRGIIASFSSRTHKRFLIDPRVRASVALVGLDARDVTYPLLLTIFEIHGFSAHEQEGVIVVVPDAYDRQTPSPLVSADNIRTSDAEIVTAIVAVKNISAVQLVPVLRPLMPQQAQLAAVTGRNALIIVDRAANVRRLVAITEALDKLPATASPVVSSGDAKGE